jgi:hypothetical protein
MKKRAKALCIAYQLYVKDNVFHKRVTDFLHTQQLYFIIIFNYNTTINKYFLYRLIYWRLGHIRALCCNELYKLYLSRALCHIPFNAAAGAIS